MSANTIPLAEFQRVMECGGPVTLLDVRTPAEYARVHVACARSMPLDKLDPVTVAAQRLDPQDRIYVICQSGGRAAKACQRLQEAGMSQVYSVEGGIAAWEKIGFPVERGGGKVISLERQVRIGAGALVLVGVVLAWSVHPAFIALAALVGAGLVFAGVTDFCGMGILLGKMPWNRRGGADRATCPPAR